MTQHRGQSGPIIRIFVERVILRNGFGFRIYDKLVRVPATRFAIKRRAPLPKNFLEFFLWLRGDLLDPFDSQCKQCSFRHFPNPRNFAHRKGPKKSLFASRRNPNESARLALIGGHFGHQPCGSETARTWESGCASNVAKEFIRGSERWSVQSFCACEIQISFVDGYHLHYG